jgi:cholesterol transport system auxiliary component
MKPLRSPLLSMLTLCGCLSGCSGLLHSSAPAVQLYVLQSPGTATPPGTAPAATTSLRIARPLAAAGLNTDRIALLRSGGRLDYYAASRWSALLPEVVSDLELAVFRTDPAISAVADDRTGLNADYLLQTSIDRFAAEYATESAAPLIRVDLHCLLIRRNDGSLLGGFAVSESETAQANRMTSVVAAFAQAADRAVSTVAARSDALLRSVKSPAAP